MPFKPSAYKLAATSAELVATHFLATPLMTMSRHEGDAQMVQGTCGPPAPSSYNPHLKREMWGTHFGFNSVQGHPPGYEWDTRHSMTR